MTDGEISIEEAIEQVREQSLGEPVRGLWWLARLRGPKDVREDPRVVEFANELVQADARARQPALHQVFSYEQIQAMGQELPATVRVDRSIRGRPSRDRCSLDEVEAGTCVPLGCIGLGDAENLGFHFPDLRPERWSLAGWVLKDETYCSIDGRHARQVVLPQQILHGLCMGHAAGLQGREIALQQPGSVHRPLAVLAPAYGDSRGRMHDVGDLLVERMDMFQLYDLARLMMRPGALCEADRQAACHYWALQAVRIHDIARMEYPVAYAGKDWATSSIARNPMDVTSVPASTISKLVCAGATLTPEIWGNERYFGIDDRPETHLIANAVINDLGLPDGQLLVGLKRLREMGHDVVVACRPDATGVTERAKPKTYRYLPLVDAAGYRHVQCMTMLLEWGADPHARAQRNGQKNRSQSAFDLAKELLRLDEEDSTSLDVLQAATARIEARKALEQCVEPGVSGMRP